MPEERRTGSARGLRLYVRLVVALGACVLMDAAIAAARTPHPFAWLGLAAVAVATGSFKLNIASISADIAIDDTFFIAIALLFGPGPATLAIAAGGCVLPVRRRRPLQQVVFNTAALAVSMWAAARTFFLLAGVRPLAVGGESLAPHVLPLVALTTIYFLLNSGLTAVAVGLDTMQRPFQVWRRHLRWLSVGYFGAASVAFCLILLLQQASLAALVLVIPLLAVFHLTLRASFGRVEDARRHVADLDRLYLSTVETLAMAIDAKDDVTHSHVRRVQAYATGLARALGISDEPTLKALEAAALLHDTGKLAVPEHILNKPGRLTPAEFEKMKLHADIGADILSLVRFPFPVEPIVRCHHENWDGSGYPRGLAGEKIPIGARILSVVDCFDALTSDRPYRARLSDESALAIVRERSGTMYDPAIVERFVAIYRDIRLDTEATPEEREVLWRINASRHDVDPPAPAPPTPFGATTDLLAFVSLARVTAGEASVLDVLALASKLVGDMLPQVTGAWYLPDASRDRLSVADTFGPAAAAVAGRTVGTGERLTGWVAATRRSIEDADAALDLGPTHGSAGLTRAMSLPLVAGETLAAVLTLYSADASALKNDRARSIQVVVPHLAGAIHAAMDTEQRRGTASADRLPPTGAALRLVSTR